MTAPARPTLLQRWATAPLPVHSGISAVAFALVSWPVELVVDDSVDVGSLTTRGVVFGALMTWFVRRLRRTDRVQRGLADQPVDGPV